jgi:hypothetical protein
VPLDGPNGAVKSTTMRVSTLAAWAAAALLAGGLRSGCKTREPGPAMTSPSPLYC